MTQTVSQLFSDINELENTILYCQNRILRKRIAIAEIFDTSQIQSGSEAGEPAEITIKTGPAQELSPTQKKVLFALIDGAARGKKNLPDAANAVAAQIGSTVNSVSQYFSIIKKATGHSWHFPDHLKAWVEAHQIQRGDTVADPSPEPTRQLRAPVATTPEMELTLKLADSLPEPFTPEILAKHLAGQIPIGDNANSKAYALIAKWKQLGWIETVSFGQYITTDKFGK